jgi:DMSO/TMAO reductase YedYZ molybdopterin-dependent catalytic subunit
MLRLTALGVAGAVMSACQPQTLGGGSATAQSSEPIIGGGGSVGSPAPPFKYDSPVAITPIGEFYEVKYSTRTPSVDGATWRLLVTGEVETPLSLSLDEIRAMPAVEEMRTLECISNPAGGDLISNAVWRGVRLADVLQRAGVKPGVTEIVIRAADDYHTAVPLELALHEYSLLVYWMNGVDLPVEHGYPARVFWPGRYGMKQPKWVTMIEAITGHHTGFWEGQGWSNEAVIKPNSRVDQPADGATIPAGQAALITGIAFATDIGISKIEVSTDDGTTWADADLVRGPSSRVWTEWRYNWQNPTAGRHVLRARVTDNDGNTQEKAAFSLLGGTFPDGTSAMDQAIVNVT